MTTLHRARRGFTMMEVMISIGILVTALVILLEMQSTAALATREADHVVVATQLAQEKLAEVRMLVESEGFSPDGDINEEGDFDDFGDELLNAQMEGLDEYHWEFLVTEIDMSLAGDLTATATNMIEGLGTAPNGATSGAAVPDMSSLGISEEMITEMLSPFIREVRVRVWWGEDMDEAEERGNQVVLTTHVINPSPNILQAAGLGGLGGLLGGGAGGLGGAAGGLGGGAGGFGAGGAGGFGGAPGGGAAQPGRGAVRGGGSGGAAPRAPVRR